VAILCKKHDIIIFVVTSNSCATDEKLAKML